MIDHPLFWILFISVIFWSFFQRFDAKRKEYIDHPRATFVYFIFSSLILAFVYPPVFSFFALRPLAILTAVFSVVATYWLYVNLPKLFTGPKTQFPEDHQYWKLLDKKYIVPKFAEIIFQQTFFGAIILLIAENFKLSISILLLGALSFILAHLPIFILQGKKIGAFYFFWAILGAPIFATILLSTGSLWYTIAFHMFFYSFLSAISWLFSPVKYS
ncbi:MAG: CPBP family glutamic-type intramembrane protease [bacterium]